MIKKKTIAIIPARAGSKRLPNKNILKLNGKPLIVWTIEAAIQSKMFDEVVVSTDSEQIRDIAIKYGADVPFLRPDFLSSDTASSSDVIKHCIDYYQKEKDISFELLTLLQPTSPLRSKKDIIGAFEILKEKRADAVISVCEMDHSPLWANTIPEDGSLSHFIKDEVKGKRSQDLPTYYRLNGAIYICNVERFINENSLFLSTNIFSYIMDINASIDIDNEIDFRLTEALIKS